MLNCNTREELKKPICIYFPFAYAPAEREDRFEQPLRDLLPQWLAHVDGGGTWLHGASDVWIFASCVTSALIILRAHLARLDAPNGTQIQYQVHDQYYHDDLCAGRWTTGNVTSQNILGLAVSA
jgi:hypothetical protein